MIYHLAFEREREREREREKREVTYSLVGDNILQEVGIIQWLGLGLEKTFSYNLLWTQ